MRGSRSKIPSKKFRPYVYIYIYDVKFLALLGAPYIYNISRLRVKEKTGKAESKHWKSEISAGWMWVLAVEFQMQTKKDGGDEIYEFLVYVGVLFTVGVTLLYPQGVLVNAENPQSSEVSTGPPEHARLPTALKMHCLGIWRSGMQRTGGIYMHLTLTGTHTA
jgi:hypothetical protein